MNIKNFKKFAKKPCNFHTEFIINRLGVFCQNLRTMNFANLQEQGFIPLYTRDKLTNILLNKEYKTRRKF